MKVLTDAIILRILRQKGLRKAWFDLAGDIDYGDNDKKKWIELYNNFFRKHGLPWVIKDIKYDSSGNEEYVLQESKKSIKTVLKEHIRKILLKENNEEEQIAIDLIDYMGKQLPRMNWKMDRRISSFFQELGMDVNDPQVTKIYQTALRLNR